MAHWLYKSEPSSWSWDDQVAAGEAGTAWTGVRNHLAKKHLQSMKVGDRGFFYHSNEGKAVVGIVEVIRDYYPDHTDPSGRFGMVDLKAVKPLREPVTLAATLISIVNLAGFWGAAFWIPTFLIQERGVDLSTMLYFQFVQYVGMFFGFQFFDRRPMEYAESEYT